MRKSSLKEDIMLQKLPVWFAPRLRDKINSIIIANGENPNGISELMEYIDVF